MLENAYLIPLLPLLGFAVLVALGRRAGDPAAGWIATAAVGGSFLCTLVAFVQLIGEEAEARSVTDHLFTWIEAGGFKVEASLLLDPLSVTMALFVTGIGFLIHLYSVSYMHGDERYPRFFVYLNLFVVSMLVLVLGDNLLLTFVGWEGVGACSYLLISFWFERESAASAGKKAFVVNRIGDFGFMIAMFLCFVTFGTLEYAGVLEGAESASHSTVTAIALLLFLGACGKSAQLPLFVWLPDAMEGPTPVSALIHAATMVTAGVYLMARSAPLLAVGGDALEVIAWIGALTALFAATIACAQNDIKRVLAYSTISQLGYMFLAVGSGAYVAAIFHMVTHAFFKALLFLGAGSVIHGLHDEKDMKRMGALKRWMPITAGTFIVGWLAIAGIFPFAGFWSKDEILLAAWGTNKVLWGIGAITALLTAYYMTRQVMLVFYGEERWREAPAADTPTQSVEDGAEQTEPEPVAAHHGGAEPHESPATMLIPLVVLAVLSVIAGGLNLPFNEDVAFLHNWLHPVFGENLHEVHVESGGKVALALVALALAGIGLAVGMSVWRRRADRDDLEPQILRDGWRVNDAYAALIDGPGRTLADWSAYVFDRKVVDGAVNGVAALVRNGGTNLRRLQTGYVRNYALGVAGGTVALLAWFLVRAW